MFSRKSTTERTAAQAWDYLSSAMAAVEDAGSRTAELAGTKAGELASLAGRKGAELADEASKLTSSSSASTAKLAGRAARRSAKLADQAGAKADVAWARANAAADALAGRKPGLPWGLIIGVGLLSAALGWAAATTARAALERRAENEELELAETAVVVTPTYEV